MEQIVTPLSFESRLRKPCVSIKLSDEWNCAFSRARPAPSTKKYRFAVLYFQNADSFVACVFLK